MYEASGQWSTTHSQPSLTDGRGERRGGGQGEGWQGLHTNHSQINSLLPQSTIPPPFSLPHLSLSFPDPAPTFTSPSFLLSPPSDYSFPPAFVSATAPPTSPRKKKKSVIWCYVVFPGLSPCLWPGKLVRRKSDTCGRRGSRRPSVPLVKVCDPG